MVRKKNYYKKINNKYKYKNEDFVFLPIFLLIFVLYKYWIKIYNTNPILTTILLLIFSCFLLICFLYVKKIKRNKYINIKTIEDMKKLNWREFEKFIEFIFIEKWFKSKVRKWTKDWWIDLDAELNWQKYVIQCKKWDKYKIWVVQLREFYWVVKMNWGETKWIYITTSSLTKEAYLEYEKIKNEVELWDISNIEKYISEYKWLKECVQKKKKEDNKIICNKCWWDMIERESKKGINKWKKFYWCLSYPKCRNIINKI